MGHLSGLAEVFSPSATSELKWQAHDSRIYVLKTLNSGEILTASRRGQASVAPNFDTLRLWSPEAESLWHLQAGRRADSLSFERAERLLVIKHAGGLLSVFDLVNRTGPEYFCGPGARDKVLDIRVAHDGEITAARVGAWGQHVYSTSLVAGEPRVTQFRIWRLPERQLLETRKGVGRFGDADLSGDGRWFAVITHDGLGGGRIDVWPTLPPR